MISSKDVLKALSHVQEPDLKKDLVTLGMIKDIEIEAHQITFTVVLTTPACPLKELIKSECIKAIHMHLGNQYTVHVNLTAEVTSVRVDTAQLLSKVKNIVAIASGKGGVGKSTVTTNLAVALAMSGAKVGLIDADIYGPSIPTMFGLEGVQPRMVNDKGKDYIVPIEKFGVQVISIGLMIPPDNALVWRGPMASSALRQFIGDVMWGELDYLLIDLPPGTGDIHLTLVQTVPVTGAIVVTTPQKVSLADANKGLAMFTQPAINVPVIGVVENMSYFIPHDMTERKYYIFGKDGGATLANKFNVPFLGELPLVQAVREGGDSGRPAALERDNFAQAYIDLASNVARQIAIRNAQLDATKKVDIRV